MILVHGERVLHLIIISHQLFALVKRGSIEKQNSFGRYSLGIDCTEIEASSFLQWLKQGKQQRLAE